MNSFNIFAQLNKELADFDQEKIYIAGSEDSQDLSRLSGTEKGYVFSQKETLNTIELYYNSKFESGDIDSEGQRKVFLNICKFKSDVASKQVDLDVKDFVFVPDEIGSEWGAYFLNKKFRQWAKRNFFGKLINEVVIDYPKYGTAVIKSVGDELVRVPLKNIRIKQSAKNIQEAEYFIEVHDKMSLYEMNELGWDTKDLDVEWDDKVDVYERYGRVPLSFYKQYKCESVNDSDYRDSVDVMAILAPYETKPGDKEYGGAILFLEEIDKRPYEEAHWSKIDGRWLGVGEIENQFENQVFRNMVVNLRRRGLLWSGKKIFQSPDPEVAKNLVKDVRDGQVLKIMPNGNITQINTTTQALGEFQAATQDIDENANQKSFTFEVATGEQMQSGTPFRLGVMLSNAVNAHFLLKRENLGIFFEEVVYNLLWPIFKKENRKAETMILPMDGEGMNSFKEELKKIFIFNNYKEQLLSGIVPDIENIQAEVDKKVNEKKFYGVELPNKFWDTLKVVTQLVITGEGVNIEKKIETLTNLYNALIQAGDVQRAERVMEKIIASTGENMDMLAGTKPVQQAMTNPMQAMGQQMGQPGQPAGGAMAQPEMAV